MPPKRIYQYSLLCILALAFTFSVRAQSQAIPFDTGRWEITADESKVVDYMGRQSLYLKNGIAAVKDSQFTDGIIEFDTAFSETRGFLGVVWRMQDSHNYENFYLRPHMSGNPDANQYQPVFNGVDAWQLYYGDGYSAPVKYGFNQWVHIRIVVSGKMAEVFINDLEKPAVVAELKRDVKAGALGLMDSIAPAYFSNFSVEAISNPPLKGKAQPSQPTPAGTVMSWMVSDTLDGKILEKKYELTSLEKQALKWQKLDCEDTGLCNLARLHGVEKERNTVFARLTINSDKEQIKPLKFGFSDGARVYLNDRLLFAGNDSYRSRDYRFLGTVGFFDEVYLPLRKGENELWMAISESFGGWGIKARFDDLDGLKLLSKD